MCPVSRTNNSEEIPVVIPDNYYEETSAYELSKVDPDWSLKLNRNLAANCRNISDEVFPGIHLGDRWKFNMTSSNYTNNQEPTLWSTYHDIKAVLEAPAIEKRQVQVLVDDSNRIVDMTLIQPNLYIGDELVFYKPLLEVNCNDTTQYTAIHSSCVINVVAALSLHLPKHRTTKVLTLLYWQLLH